MQRGDARFARVIGCFAVIDEFAVAAIAHTRLAGAVPQIAFRRLRHFEIAFAGIGIFAAPIMAVAERPEFFDKIRGIRAHAPFMAVGAHLALDIKIVEQHEFARELVVVGRDFFTEQTQARIAVALRQIAQDLVVGAVLLDDVDAILDRAGFTHSSGNRVVRRALACDAKVRLHGAAAIGLRRPGPELVPQLLALGQVDYFQCAAEQAADVFAHAGGRFLARLRAMTIGFGNDPLPVGDQQTFAVGRDANGSGIPADRDETERTAFAGHADIKHGNVVVIGVRDEQDFLIR